MCDWCGTRASFAHAVNAHASWVPSDWFTLQHRGLTYAFCSLSCLACGVGGDSGWHYSAVPTRPPVVAV